MLAAIDESLYQVAILFLLGAGSLVKSLLEKKRKREGVEGAGRPGRAQSRRRLAEMEEEEAQGRAPARDPWQELLEGGDPRRVEASAALGRSKGRDHHPQAFTMWFAGGGVKLGSVVGETDEFGFGSIQDECHVHDLHATILHLLGLDHEKLTYRFQGRDFRLTDVHGKLVKGILA